MSGMLSHLRFHRRAPSNSNPASPIPESSAWDAASLQPPQLVPERVPTPEIRPRADTTVPYAHHHHHRGHSHSQSPSQIHSAQPPATTSPSQDAPPILPPIARVTSNESDTAFPISEIEVKQFSRVSHHDDSGFVGGRALQSQQRTQQEGGRPSSFENTNRPRLSTTMTAPTRSAGKQPSTPASTSSFVTPTDLHNTGATGKRQPGARVSLETQATQIQHAIQEPSKGKKGLPFLKNPMSTLLLRRKTGHHIPELSIHLGREEQHYQPIRGTRVHDFSAPRPKKVVSVQNVEKALPETTPQEAIIYSTAPMTSTAEQQSTRQPAPSVSSKRPPNSSVRSASSAHSRSYSVDAALLDKGTQSSSETLLSSRDSKRGNGQDRRNSSGPESIASLSRNVSGVSNKEGIPSVPQHMKSTSSRFSFDMIGAANAEKVLEERHRQKQQDKQPGGSTKRDSRFDDFDEDTFDYDAMDFDDGLEERIPGVNADFDEEELDAFDPDNDQINFAGFTFQRSNPISEMTSPEPSGLLSSPRSGIDDQLGSPVTQETSDFEQESEPSHDTQQENTAQLEALPDPTGLGIEDTELETPSPSRNILQQNPTESLSETPIPSQMAVAQPLNHDDELYFGGLGHEFDGEGDGTIFDESLFDLNDTDEFGRPIPGMFARELAQRMAEQQSSKRDSDEVTSRLSGQSGTTESTAHSSMSLGMHHKAACVDGQGDGVISIKAPVPQVLGLAATAQDKMAVYQAALAAAAHKAAAAGKFRRDSDPELPQPADLTVTSPTTTGSNQSQTHVESLEDYEKEEDDGFGNGLDDYDLDDDAMIDEANAEALANDSDGWYGQEFGFYSAPAPQPHRGHSALSEENLYEYSNGGYFGPSGIGRTKSGHVVSREPNLTPITERSEYSNRNSIMSLNLANGSNKDAPVQSPGLAQLAKMSDDDSMSMSALLRLRSKAFGGSQASLVSSREGSPGDRQGASSPLAWTQDSKDYIPLGGHARKNSAFSLWSQESGAGSGSGSPTLTMPQMTSAPISAVAPLNPLASSLPNSTASPLSPVVPPSSIFPPVMEDDEADDMGTPATNMTSSGTWSKPSSATEPLSPTVGMPSQKRPGMGHRHRGSADSISYTKEEESGETRWVIERRRTAESGEIEILGRQIVEGGRI